MEILVKDFFKTLNREALSLELSGIYFSNEDIYDISESLKFDISMGVREDMIKELFEKCAADKKGDELKNELLKIANSRTLEYEKILSESYCDNVDKLLRKVEGFKEFLIEVEGVEG